MFCIIQRFSRARAAARIIMHVLHTCAVEWPQRMDRKRFSHRVAEFSIAIMFSLPLRTLEYRTKVYIALFCSIGSINSLEKGIIQLQIPFLLSIC